jgi:predicted DNA-binding transcriptional regulator AlpA
MNVLKSSPLPPPEVRILGEREAALRLNLGCRTLQEMRLRGTGPQFIKLGARRVGYDVRDLDAWVSSRRAASTSAEVRA